MNDNDSKNEITGILLFFCAIALMLIFYLLPGDIFIVKIFHDLAFGLIGKISAFLIPVSILYAAIDFFIEKKSEVSRLRVRSVVILVVLISALLAVCTMDFNHFRELSLNGTGDKVSAFAGIKLLWKSGIDSTIISATGTKSVWTGGLLGGGIAVALYTVMGKVISILTLVLLLLSQIIYVFSISIKKTAKKAASRAVSTINNVRSNNRRPSQGRTQPRPQGMPARRPNGPNGVPANGNFVQKPAPRREQPSYGRELLNNPSTDPFSRGAFRRDPKSGFSDLSDKEFGVDTRVDNSKISYGVKNAVSTEESYNAPSADFTYTAMPKTTKLRPKKDVKMHSFDNNNGAHADFYNLDNASYGVNTGEIPGAVEINQDVNQPNVSTYYNNAGYSSVDDEPVEIFDGEDEDPYYLGPKEHNVREVNLSSALEQNLNYYAGINTNVVAQQAPVMPMTPAAPVEPVAPVAPSVSVMPAPVAPVAPVAPAAPVNSGIAINSNSEESGFSSTEGRIIETNNAPDPEPQFETAVSEPAQPTGKIISKRMKPYVKPSPRLLAPDNTPKNNANSAELQAKAHKLEEAIKSFGIDTKVTQITHGPAITRFELEFLKAGVKVSRILGLQDDIALAMAAFSVRIEAPIPGTNRIGIEIPNEKTSAVHLRGLIESKEFHEAGPLTVPLGRDIPGRPIMCNLAKMPHLLIAGSTGSGKSVCINTILTSILFNSSYDDVRMILVDPKVVELSIYNGIPHLIMPVVTDPKKAAAALKWAVVEMERRYKCFAEASVRDLAGYNEYLKMNGEKPLPLVLIVIDELADLMTVAQKEVEESISRLAAMARAAGLHMIIATQRPSVDVITGVIKSNVPSRIAFAVSSGVDSRTILDSIGAEKLLGKGDMLYAPLSAPKPIRGQGAFLSDKEVESVVKYLKDKFGPYYDEDIIKAVENAATGGGGSAAGGMGASDDGDGSGEDEFLELAVDTVIEAKTASISILQRRLGIGYPRAARLIDTLEMKHYIGPHEGSKPRKVLITKTDWLEIKAKGGNS